ncbi:hypothetical protein GCM10009067_34270 [Haloarcula sebkhae]|uniref:Transposase IS4-like domain-containing protein n=1 Tax=Haloarcula sebkhae TaxID=932660 RepID=A0A830F3K1_9EURY|nr:hypothetical protein GCM10009067_34270 [Haloarcula sebkhae]
MWALVFGFAAGESRTLAGFRRSYNATADETISPGGFYHRLTPTLAEYLRDLVERGLDEVAVPDPVDTDIDRFRDVMIADGTVLRLHEFLSDEFQSRHEEQAGAKLHLLHNATDQTIERIDVTDEKTHDSTLFKTGSWLHGRLVLFDEPAVGLYVLNGLSIINVPRDQTTERIYRCLEGTREQIPASVF